MSYDTVLSFKINRKAMTITGRYRSSNCFDMFNRRVVEDYMNTYKTYVLAVQQTDSSIYSTSYYSSTF